MNASVNTLYLGDVSWSVEDAHKLLSCLSITKLRRLDVLEECQLKHDKSFSTTSTSRVIVDTIYIRASLVIDVDAGDSTQRVFRTLFAGGNVFKIKAGEPKQHNVS